MSNRIAYTLQGHPSIVNLEDGKRLSTKDAIKQGYTVFEWGTNKQLSGKQEEAATFAEQIADLPEAQSRPRAAMRLAQISSPKAMTLDRAASFLRGLPEEAAPKVSAPTPAPRKVDMALFRRKAELRVAALGVSASRGDEGAQKEATKINYALRIFDTGGVSLAEAFTAAKLDARAAISTILNAGA